MGVLKYRGMQSVARKASLKNQVEHSNDILDSSLPVWYK